MSREEYTISTFDKGIVSSADQADIIQGAAAWSIEENPDSIPGTIQPRMTDTVHFDVTAAGDFCIEKHSWIAREDGKKDLVLFNAKDNTIEAITDFHGTPVYSPAALGTPTGTSIAMTTTNRAVRIGQGNYASKYVGYIDQGQFGGAAPSAAGLSYVDAELAKPSTFPTPYKTVSDATYLYGIEWQGTKILKITAATGAVTQSTVDFVSLQGICDIDATYMYVFDTIGNFGNVYKIAKTDLSIYETYHVTGWGTLAATFNATAGSYISDIETTTNNLWFSVWKSGGWTIAQAGLAIYNIALSSLTVEADIIPTDVTFVSAVNGSVTGPWDGGVNGEYYNTMDGTVLYAGIFYPGTPYWIKPAKRTFVKTATATEIGWLGDVGLIARVVYKVVVGPDTTHAIFKIDQRYGGRGIIFMNESSAKDDLLYSTNTRFRSLDTGVTTYTEDTTDLLYTDGLKLIGSVKEDYLFTRESTGTLDIYFSDGTAEFKLSDATWTDTTAAPATRTVNTVVMDRLEEKTWQDYVPQTEEAKSTIGDLTDITISTADTGGADKDVTVRFLSTVDGEGKFGTRIYDTTAFSGGTTAYVATGNAAITVTDTTNTEGTFDITKRYFYKIAFEYDTSQVSPLMTTPASLSVAVATNTVDVFIELYNTSALSDRVTAVLIFRAESGATTKYSPDTLYRLAGRISTENSWTNDTSEHATWGDKLTFSFTDIGLYGPSYETETGCPETLSNNTMYYTISCTGRGYHFVGQAYNTELDKVSNLIFRSKQNAPDTFDWSNDFCVLPIMPIALHYFKGYLYAFDNSKMYIIDPEALVLIGEYAGFGVSNPLAICSNEDAMFGANQDNIWMHDGKNPVIISDPINQVGTTISGATSHRTLQSNRTISMVVSPINNCLIVAYFKYVATLDTYTPMFVFNFKKGAWYYWLSTNVAGTNIDYSTSDKRSLIVDYTGKVYLSVYKGLLKLLGSTSGKTCTWYSKEINFGDDTALKKIYKIIFNGTVTTSLYGTDGTTPATAFTSSTYLSTFATKYRTLQLGFTLADGKIIKGITIIYRKMIGLR